MFESTGFNGLKISPKFTKSSRSICSPSEGFSAPLQDLWEKSERSKNFLWLQKISSIVHLFPVLPATYCTIIHMNVSSFFPLIHPNSNKKKPNNHVGVLSFLGGLYGSSTDPQRILNADLSRVASKVVANLRFADDWTQRGGEVFHQQKWSPQMVV